MGEEDEQGVRRMETAFEQAVEDRRRLLKGTRNAFIIEGVMAGAIYFGVKYIPQIMDYFSN